MIFRSITFFAILISPFLSFASAVTYKAQDFHCSDGETYRVVLRHVSRGGPTNGSWAMEALCSTHTIEGGEYMLMPPPEIEDCRDEESPEIRSCFFEFQRYNGDGGRGGFPTLLHGRTVERRQTSSQDDPISCGSSGMMDGGFHLAVRSVEGRNMGTLSQVTYGGSFPMGEPEQLRVSVSRSGHSCTVSLNHNGSPFLRMTVVPGESQHRATLYADFRGNRIGAFDGGRMNCRLTPRALQTLCLGGEQSPSRPSVSGPRRSQDRVRYKMDESASVVN